MKSRLFVIATLLMVQLLLGVAAASDESHAHGFKPHHHLSVMLGYALERKRAKDKEAGAIGLDYGYRFAEQWSVGGFVEGLGDDVIRDVSIGVVGNWHPAEGWALFAGPGFEFTEKDDEWLFRVGVGYDVHLQNDWTLGPKLMYDMITGGKRTTILGIALGKEF